jgi:hypothetical protein
MILILKRRKVIDQRLTKGPLSVLVQSAGLQYSQKNCQVLQATSPKDIFCNYLHLFYFFAVLGTNTGPHTSQISAPC